MPVWIRTIWINSLTWFVDSSLSRFSSLRSSVSKVLVKKIYADKSTRHRRRQWKLKHLEVDDAASMDSTIER